MDLWCGAGGYWYYPEKTRAQDIKKLVQRAADLGVKRLFPYVAQGPTVLRMIDAIGTEVPNERTFADYYARQGWNPIGFLVETAHAHGMEVHPYVALHYQGAQLPNYHSYVNERFPYMTISQFANRHPEFWRKTRSGSTSLDVFGYVILSPAFEEVRRYEIQQMVDLLRETGADGIQLEYLWGPVDEAGASILGYEDPAVARFRHQHGEDPFQVPNDHPAWLQVRADYETQLLRELRAALASLGRPVKLTATVISQSDPAGYLRVLHDWPAWVREGLLDGLFLWHRHRDMGRIRTETAYARAIVPEHVELVAQLAAWGENRLNTEELLVQAAEESLAAGASGIGVYRMDALQTFNLWDALPKLARMAR